ncbi:hypothetical protein E5Q_01387 [Mixia osmundae IAM 14324]|uniref:TFIIS central domain-containing protein n=1 Tax=Mixia osmundae (strain CBS 9802 / IAM 14324 / JCM 22182 / KY 12970) TaxID=764103 RepID=G7DVX3_MIXOS|nr:hypothetical protein E5Q_01387 [Mixia osmundae IAM 14324]
MAGAEAVSSYLSKCIAGDGTPSATTNESASRITSLLIDKHGGDQTDAFRADARSISLALKKDNAELREQLSSGQVDEATLAAMINEGPSAFASKLQQAKDEQTEQDNLDAALGRDAVEPQPLREEAGEGGLKDAAGPRVGPNSEQFDYR